MGGCFCHRNENWQQIPLKKFLALYQIFGNETDPFPGGEVTGEKTVLANGDKCQTIVTQRVIARRFREPTVTEFYHNSPIEYGTSSRLLGSGAPCIPQSIDQELQVCGHYDLHAV